MNRVPHAEPGTCEQCGARGDTWLTSWRDEFGAWFDTWLCETCIARETKVFP